MLTDARVLDETFIPSEIVHRDDEMNTLTRALDPVLDGRTARTTFLFEQ